MRATTTTDGLTVRAIAGTYVVMLNLDMARADCDGLLGFAIHRTDHQEGEGFWLRGAKRFKSVPHDAPDFAGAGAVGASNGGGFSSRSDPIQDFSWSDLTAKPGRKYTYEILALYGDPADPQPRRSTKVDVETESEAGGDHDVYFNRGSAASQEYARRFENRPPDQVGEEAWRWLSRGLHEALLAFIQRARDKGWGLRVAAYEFTDETVLSELRQAVDRGVDVEIIYHAREAVDTKTVTVKGKRKEQQTQTGANRAAVKAAGLKKDICHERLAKPTSAISHNKFIVLLQHNKPVALLTGSTNFSQGGIFGHSNVVQVVDDPTVAATYLGYWEQLLADPHKKELAPELTGELKMPEGLPPDGSTCVFSPRSTSDALECYCRLASQAKDALFVTLAFGMNDLLHDVFQNGKAPLRFALMEKTALATANKARDRAEEERIIALRKMPENRIGVGSFIPRNAFDHWLAQRLTVLNAHVRFVHTKYMVLDPLGDDPIVVTGSANFSQASCVENDENMLIIRGNTRVADIYLGEFMRLYRHYAFTDFVSSGAAERQHATPQYLDETNSWWRRYFGDTPFSRLREYFAASNGGSPSSDGGSPDGQATRRAARPRPASPGGPRRRLITRR